jgi:streptogramin lyase
MNRALLVSILLAATPPIASADLFVSSFSQHSIRRYDETTGAFISTFIAAGSGNLSAPHRSLFGPDGAFYVASANNDRILRYDGTTGAYLGIFAQAPQLDYPVDFQWGPDGNLYVSSQLNDSIVRFNGSTGAFLDVFVAPGSGGLQGPSGIQFHNGDLFVAGRFSNAAYRYDGTTGAHELTIGTGVINVGYGLDFGPDGNLYVASGGGHRVNEFDPVTGASLGAFVTTTSGGLSAPIGIEFTSDGELLVASLNTDSVKAYSGTTGSYLSDRVTAGSGGLDSPNYFTVAVPEPAGAALFVLGSFFAALSRRRR